MGDCYATHSIRSSTSCQEPDASVESFASQTVDVRILVSERHIHGLKFYRPETCQLSELSFMELQVYIVEVLYILVL